MIYNTEVVVFLEMAKFQEKKGERNANYILLEELSSLSFLFQLFVGKKPQLFNVDPELHK